ncbi:Oidioi.mRNA.OKI2018_I69.chr1.g3421.t1.cds [Oikopleura dioica]|uniref:Oidioi.mRNA.OKI2018_I69.chr1.g3421.t1.cds n=1 Tax=Oikopleura dioica TaxID=34765 RepID=A0ABN7SYD2_OIKDI|nr:Oidioi.mRNA.OKI2018_I69.chr1.g3421.t1.cds [Oikopleura dioica]
MLKSNYRINRISFYNLFCPDIVDFDVEDGSDCLYDVLTIRAEALPEATSSIDVREMKLCGNSWKGESLFFNETSHQIVNLEFKTNEFFSRRGFLLALELKEDKSNEMKRAAVGDELSSVSQGSSTVSATFGSTTQIGESTGYYSVKTSTPNARTMTIKQVKTVFSFNQMMIFSPLLKLNPLQERSPQSLLSRN